MKNQASLPSHNPPSTVFNNPLHPATARRAWLLWNQLTDLADQLWDNYEFHFLQFCIEHNTVHPTRPVEPMPFD